MSNSQATGGKVQSNSPDHNAKPLVYERYCRLFNKTPIPELLDYAKITDASEQKVLNERLDTYEKNPIPENRENIRRNFSDFPTSVALDHQYRLQQKRDDEENSKSKSK